MSLTVIRALMAPNFINYSCQMLTSSFFEGGGAFCWIADGVKNHENLPTSEMDGQPMFQI
jgi:hypothetical protein